MPASSGFILLRKELCLKRKMGNNSKFEEDMPLGTLVEKWPKFLALLPAQLPGGTGEALAMMRAMCPGKQLTLEELKRECDEKGVSFCTPFVRLRGKATQDLQPRTLVADEVHVINETYLDMRKAFADDKKVQDAGAAVADAQQDLSGQAHAYHEETLDLV